jgi:hypothetical protein
MTRFDIGVVVVTFVIFGVAAIIRNVVVPAVRYRTRRYRLPSSAKPAAAIPRAHRRHLDLEDPAR